MKDTFTCNWGSVYGYRYKVLPATPEMPYGVRIIIEHSMDTRRKGYQMACNKLKITEIKHRRDETILTIRNTSRDPEQLAEYVYRRFCNYMQVGSQKERRYRRHNAHQGSTRRTSVHTLRPVYLS